MNDGFADRVLGEKGKKIVSDVVDEVIAEYLKLARSGMPKQQIRELLERKPKDLPQTAKTKRTPGL